MNKYKVLIIKNDENSASDLQIALQSYQYQVMSTNRNISKVKNRLKTFVPDMVIINNVLDDMRDTIIWAKYIIQEEVPCIICTSNMDIDKIRHISRMELCGFFIRPFSLLSLHGMIQMSLHKLDKEKNKKENFNHIKKDNENLRQLLFGKEIIETPMIRFGKGFSFHTSNCETFYKNKRVLLTKKENLFIQLLVSNLGHTVNFEQAIKYIWDKTNVSENNVRTLVWRLRSKLQLDIIKTVSGVGYYIEETYTSFQNNSKSTILSYNKELKDSA